MIISISIVQNTSHLRGIFFHAKSWLSISFILHWSGSSVPLLKFTGNKIVKTEALRKAADHSDVCTFPSNPMKTFCLPSGSRNLNGNTWILLVFCFLATGHHSLHNSCWGCTELTISLKQEFFKAVFATSNIGTTLSVQTNTSCRSASQLLSARG